MTERRGISFYGFYFLWEVGEAWRRMENNLNLPVQLQLPYGNVLAFPMAHTHEESPLQSPLLNSWPKVWFLGLERGQMGHIQLQYSR